MAEDQIPLTEFQEGLVRCLDRTGSHGMQCARSAVRHLVKAWRIRELDLGMALLRCLTAEEEASTAIFLAIKARQYDGAGRINHRNHRHKMAVLPFFHAVSANFAKVDSAPLEPKIELNERGERPTLRVRLTLAPPGVEPKWAYPEPPLNFSLSINDEVHDFRHELRELSDATGIADVLDHIERQANLRNRILYATPEGVPEVTGDAAAMILARRDSIFDLVTAFLLIEETTECQLFAQQCLTAFLKMLRRLPATDDGSSSGSLTS